MTSANRTETRYESGVHHQCTFLPPRSHNQLQHPRFIMSLIRAEITAAQIELLINHTFTDKLLAAEAVQMAAPNVAAISQSLFRELPNNKRLSVLGDAVQTKVLCGLWFNARGKNACQHSFDM
jgi:hypothetical protein